MRRPYSFKPGHRDIGSQPFLSALITYHASYHKQGGPVFHTPETVEAARRHAAAQGLTMQELIDKVLNTPDPAAELETRDRGPYILYPGRRSPAFGKKEPAKEVQFEPAVQAKLDRIARESGRVAAELVQDAVAGYVDELAGTRDMLDSRYDDIKSGKVKLIDGEEAFARLRERIDARPNDPA